MALRCLPRLGLPPLEHAPAAAHVEAAPLSNEAILTKSLETLSQYKVGGEGLRALKTLRIYVNNALTVRMQWCGWAPFATTGAKSVSALFFRPCPTAPGRGEVPEAEPCE